MRVAVARSLKGPSMVTPSPAPSIRSPSAIRWSPTTAPLWWLRLCQLWPWRTPAPCCPPWEATTQATTTTTECTLTPRPPAPLGTLGPCTRGTTLTQAMSPPTVPNPTHSLLFPSTEVLSLQLHSQMVTSKSKQKRVHNIISNLFFDRPCTPFLLKPGILIERSKSVSFLFFYYFCFSISLYKSIQDWIDVNFKFILLNKC